jgi:CRP/FNR family transcriptional regulator, anaerobic regulatory protein
MEAVAVAGSVTPFSRVTITRPRPMLREVSRAMAQCSTCSLQEHCVPAGLDTEAARLLDRIVTSRIRLRKRDVLIRPSQPFTALYAIRSGSCKTVLIAEDGNEQVSGYHLAGEIIGADGIATARHDCQAVALEDAEVCVLPFERIEQLARNDGRVQATLHRLLSSEIAREHNLMLMLGTMRAHQRLASYLLDLSQRYGSRGYSSSEFVLRMTREEIGSYLGLELETVSRLFSRFHREGLIQVQARLVKLLDRIALKQLVAVSS